MRYLVGGRLGRRCFTAFVPGAVVLSVALWCAPVWADAIPSDPPCPPNELVYPGGHQGRMCGAKACVSDGDCAANEACMKYCSTPGGIFGVDATTTGRCTTDDQCGSYQCKPRYCEVGARAPAEPEGRPAAPVATGSGGDGSAPSPPATGSEGTAGRGSQGEPRKAPVDDDGGCRVQGGPSSSGRWSALALVAVAAAALRRVQRSPCGRVGNSAAL